MDTTMNKKFLIAGILLMTLVLLLITSSMMRAQTNDEFVVPLSDPSHRAKLRIVMAGTRKMKTYGPRENKVSMSA